MDFRNATPTKKKEQINKWKDMSLSDLTQLINQNENTLKTHQDALDEISACQKELLTIVRDKECQAIREKISKITEAEQGKMLSMIPHSSSCERDKFKLDSYSGVDSYYNPPKIICPHCALKYIFKNPWLDVDFTMSVDFDFSHYVGGAC